MRILSSILKKTAYFTAFFALIFIVLAFTDIPFWAYHRLGELKQQLEKEPDYIIVMGGDGMPSPAGLMRCYYGVHHASKFPQSKIILAMPYNLEDSTYQLELMKAEFVVKGIDSNRISFAPKGYNTRTQALEISQQIQNKNANLLIVTSPEHTYRTLACFQKLGFKSIGGSPTFEHPPDEDFLDNKKEKDRMRVSNLNLRYNVWSYMQYEIIVLREYVAISYYWLKAWI